MSYGNKSTELLDDLFDYLSIVSPIEKVFETANLNFEAAFSSYVSTSYFLVISSDLSFPCKFKLAGYSSGAFLF
jgi:hypothetical protein